MRKPIQGWSVLHKNGAVATFALCDDGTIWWFLPDIENPEYDEWEKFPLIPQDGE